MAPPIIVVGAWRRRGAHRFRSGGEKLRGGCREVPDDGGGAVLLTQEPLGAEVLGGLEDPRDLAGREDDPDDAAVEETWTAGEPVV
jgi:hypothetical protein